MKQEELNVFDEKIKELARDLTYDEFVQIVMRRIQKNDETILDLWRDGDTRFVSVFDPLFPGDTYLCVISPDTDWDEERAEDAYPDFKYYISWSFDTDKLHMLHSLYWDFDLFHTPPMLWEKKKLLDRTLRPLDYSTRDERVRKSGHRHDAYLLADRMIEDYELSHINGETEWFFFKCKHNCFDPVIIVGIDLYRGRVREQRIIAELVRIDCQADSRVVFQLWDTDAGFETLKEELLEYEEKGQVIYERSRYNENFTTGEDTND